MRGSALSSPMGVPLGYFHGYKKEEDERKRNVRAMLSYLPLALGCPLSFYSSTLHKQEDKQQNTENRENIPPPPLFNQFLVLNETDAPYTIPNHARHPSRL